MTSTAQPHSLPETHRAVEPTTPVSVGSQEQDATGAGKGRWAWVYRVGLAVLPLVLTLGFFYRPFLQGSPLPVGGDRDFYVYQLARTAELKGRWWRLGRDDLLGQPYHSQMAHHPQLYEGVDLLLLSSLSARILDPISNYHVLSILVLLINGWVAAWIVLRLTRSYGWAALGTVLIILNICTDMRVAGHLHLFKYGWMLLAMWAFLRYLEVPTLGRGIVLGFLLGLLLASCFYWGFFGLVCLGVWWLGCLIAGSLRRQHWLAAGAAGATFALVAAVVTYPIWRPSFRANADSAEYFERSQHDLWDCSSEPWQYFVSHYWTGAPEYFVRREWESPYEGWNYPGLVILLALGAYLLGRLRGWQLDEGRPRFLGPLLGLSAVLVIMSLWGGPALFIYKLVPTFRSYGRAGMMAVGLWCVAAPVILYSLAHRMRRAPVRLAFLGGVMALALYEGESQFGRGGQNYTLSWTRPDPAWATWLAEQPADVRLAFFPLDYYDNLTSVADFSVGVSPYYVAYLRCFHRHATLGGCNPRELSADLAESGSTLASVTLEGLRDIVELGYNALAFHRDYLQSHPWIEALTGLEPVEVLDEWHIYRVNELPDVPIYLPGTRIDFTKDSPKAFLEGDWYPREDGWKWCAAEATLRFKLELARPLRLRMMSTTFGKQRVVVGLNGREITAFEQNSEGLELIEFDLPSEVLAASNTLTFALPDARTPKSVGLNEDERILGLGIAWMELVPTG